MKKDIRNLPPCNKAEARERVRKAAEPFVKAILERGAIVDIRCLDGLTWWQRPKKRFGPENKP